MRWPSICFFRRLTGLLAGLLFGAAAMGGTWPADSVNLALVDSAANKKFLSGFELLVDYGKILTLPLPQENKWEAGAQLRLFERIVLVGEYGQAVLNPNSGAENTSFYTIEGAWYRLGLDYYTALDPKNFYYAGLRYAVSDFSDAGELWLTSDLFPDYRQAFGSDDLQASWVELVLGSETSLTIGKEDSKLRIRGLFLGWKFRFRVLLEFENRELQPVANIPGFGRAEDKTVPALNLYLKYRFGR